MKPSDYVNDINFKKKNLMRDSDNDKLAESGYIPYITNKSLSYFPDTLFLSNDMNVHHHIAKLLQYE